MSDEQKGAIGAVLRWRNRLAYDSGANRAARARLKRCASVLDALMERETIALVQSVRAAGNVSRGAEERLAVIAIALARGSNEARISFATALGRTAGGNSPGEGERPKLAPARFTSLIRHAREEDWDGLIRSLRRAMAMLGDAPFNVGSFAADLLYLSDRTLQRWTYDYWQTVPPDDLASPQQTIQETLT